MFSSWMAVLRVINSNILGGYYILHRNVILDINSPSYIYRLSAMGPGKCRGKQFRASRKDRITL